MIVCVWINSSWLIKNHWFGSRIKKNKHLFSHKSVREISLLKPSNWDHYKTISSKGFASYTLRNFQTWTTTHEKGFHKLVILETIKIQSEKYQSNNSNKYLFKWIYIKLSYQHTYCWVLIRMVVVKLHIILTDNNLILYNTNNTTTTSNNNTSCLPRPLYERFLKLSIILRNWDVHVLSSFLTTSRSIAVKLLHANVSSGCRACAETGRLQRFSEGRTFYFATVILKNLSLIT